MNKPPKFIPNDVRSCAAFSKSLKIELTRSIDLKGIYEDESATKIKRCAFAFSVYIYSDNYVIFSKLFSAKYLQIL